jgi:hypothetical protein
MSYALPDTLHPMYKEINKTSMLCSCILSMS